MSRLLALLVAGLLPVTSAGPQAVPPKKPARPAPPASVVLEGTVKGPDGRAIEKALVIARSVSARFDEPSFTTRTDSAGGFRFVFKNADLHNVRVEAKGLAAQRLEKVKPGSPLNVTLQKGGAIEGTVREAASGAPVAEARVEARPADVYVDALPWEPEAGRVVATTDAKGRFRLEGLASGLHDVTATAQGFGPARRPNAKAGTFVDFVLTPGSSLSGSVVAPDGQPVAGAVVRAEREPGFWAESARAATNAQGHFEILGLEPGTYTLVARHADFAPGLVPAVVVEPESDTSTDIVLDHGARIVGRLLGPSERPVAGRVRIQEIGGRTVSAAVAQILRAEAGADGLFSIERVPTGSYALAVTAPGLASTRADVDVRPGDLEVDAGDITLEAGLAIRGRVRDKAGVGIASATIECLRLRGSSGDSPGARSEADGSFVLGGLQSGSYMVLVSASGYGRSRRQVEAGQDVEFVLESGGSIAGIVVDEAGRPVEAYEVSAELAERQGSFFWSPNFRPVAASDGRFALEDLGPGTYVVGVQAPEYASSSVSNVRVRSGAPTDVGRIRLQRGGTVRGLVVSIEGAPVAGATVEVQGAANSGPMGGETPQATSDATGAFEVRGVPAGVVEVMATHTSYAAAVVSGLEVDPAKGPAEARIVLTRGGRIEGLARKRDGSALQGTYVHVTPTGGGRRMFWAMSVPSPVGADGSFVVEHVPAGRVRVNLMSRSGGRFTSIQTKEADVRESEATPVEFRSLEILVSGRVTRSGTPAANLKVTLGGGAGHISMSFGGAESVPPPPSGPQRGSAVTREDGTYDLLVDAPGQYFARVETLDGKVGFRSKDVDVPEAETYVLDFDIGGVTVSGLVVDKESEQPLAASDVWASLKGASRGGVGAAAGADGRFQLELEPGDYRVTARAEGYASQTVEISVGATGAPDLRFPLARGLNLRGRLLDARGRGVGGLWVNATSGEESDRHSVSGTTLADGSFQLSELLQRPYALLSGSDLAGFAFRAGVPPGDSDVVLTLRPGGKVRVQVRGTDGAPASRAWVRVDKLGGISVGSFSHPLTDSDGFAELPVPAGVVEIGVGKDSLKGRVTLNVSPGETVAAEVRLAPPGDAP